ncbi:MAG: hypothetical protein DWQ01_19095 [Planctomycetota bacterium]|nr:MAG: hypothetical protein DWQ01_19095 [Planctomycetota bacterium]
MPIIQEGPGTANQLALQNHGRDPQVLQLPAIGVRQFLFGNFDFQSRLATVSGHQLGQHRYLSQATAMLRIKAGRIVTGDQRLPVDGLHEHRAHLRAVGNSRVKRQKQHRAFDFLRP